MSRVKIDGPTESPAPARRTASAPQPAPALLNRRSGPPGIAQLLQLQRTLGNRAVGQLLAIQRSPIFYHERLVRGTDDESTLEFRSHVLDYMEVSPQHKRRYMIGLLRTFQGLRKKSPWDREQIAWLEDQLGLDSTSSSSGDDGASFSDHEGSSYDSQDDDAALEEDALLSPEQLAQQQQEDTLGFGLDYTMPSMALITANAEKFGKNTSNDMKEAKIEAYGKTVERYNPQAMLFQEITVVQLFKQQLLAYNLLEETQENMEEFVETYEKCQHTLTTLLQRIKSYSNKKKSAQRGLEQVRAELVDTQEFLIENEAAYRSAKQRLESGVQYALSEQYKFYDGPFYQSYTNMESNPLLLDSATIFEPPKLTIFDQPSQTFTPHDGNTIYFGKEFHDKEQGIVPERKKRAKKKQETETKQRGRGGRGRGGRGRGGRGRGGQEKARETKATPQKPRPQQARKTATWELDVPINPHGLRPPTKGHGSKAEQRQYSKAHKNLSHRTFGSVKVYVLNVHTSPKISSITKQVDEIMEAANLTAENQPYVIVAGDFYMQNKAKRWWQMLQCSDEWMLGIPENNTNYPPKYPETQGQIADHFIVKQSGFAMRGTIAIPPPEVIDSITTENPDMQDNLLGIEVEDDDLADWRERSIDHTPVLIVLDFKDPGSSSSNSQEDDSASSDSEERARPPGRSAKRKRSPSRDNLPSTRKRTAHPSSESGQRNYFPPPSDLVALVKQETGKSFLKISGRGLNCYIRSIVSWLFIKGFITAEHIEDAVSNIVRELAKQNLRFEGQSINAGGLVAAEVQRLVNHFANVDIAISIVQWNYTTGQLTKFKANDGAQKVTLLYTPGHFDLLW